MNKYGFRLLASLMGFGLLLLLGCGGSGAPEAASPSEGEEVDPSESVAVEITNDNLNEVTFWAILDGRRQPLGSLRPNRAGTYRIPVRGATEIHLEIRITTGPRCITESRMVGPGEVIVARIPVDPAFMIGAICR